MKSKRNYVHKYGVLVHKPKVETPKSKYTRKRKHKNRELELGAILTQALCRVGIKCFGNTGAKL